MADDDEIVCVHPADREIGDPTPGKVRERAIAAGGMWSGLVRTEPGVASGWHHHGDHETVVYVITGEVRIEFGPGGRRSADGGPGDFLRIPRRLIHREVNRGSIGSEEVVTRCGSGPLTVNVDGPEASG